MAILPPFVWHSCYLQFCRIVSLIGIIRDASLQAYPIQVENPLFLAIEYDPLSIGRPGGIIAGFAAHQRSRFQGIDIGDIQVLTEQVGEKEGTSKTP